MENSYRNFFRRRGTISLLGSLLSILAGLLLGFALLLVFNPSHALTGLSNMLFTGLRDISKLGKVLYTAAPLLMTGLSVGFAFKTGLFNIGASGQYTMGSFFALVAGIQFQLPWYVAMLAGMLGGAIWGAIPGIFKAHFNVNEVITAIMFNWIGLFAVNLSLNNMPMMIASYWGAVTKERTAKLTDANPAAILPKLGLDESFGNYMNIGFFIAILSAVVIWIILSKTTFGYELKACGYNRSASLYAGINDKRNIILSMTIAGALSGVGGAIYYLSGTAQFTIVKALLTMGFNGIPVALLASSNPLGTIFSALFVSYIQVGGDMLQPEFAKEIIDIIIAAIIYLSAFALLVQGVIAKLLVRTRKNCAPDAREEDDRC
ncbi:MAG: ABC transporter permease [Clostridiales bacterium]|nr:ABC transporter permease [Clostridiales bacterium]